MNIKKSLEIESTKYGNYIYGLIVYKKKKYEKANNLFQLFLQKKVGELILDYKKAEVYYYIAMSLLRHSHNNNFNNNKINNNKINNNNLKMNIDNNNININNNNNNNINNNINNKNDNNKDNLNNNMNIDNNNNDNNNIGDNKKEILNYFKLAIEKCEFWSKVYYRRGENYLLEGKFELAKNDFLNAVKYNLVIPLVHKLSDRKIQIIEEKIVYLNNIINENNN